MVLLEVPRGWLLFMSEVPSYPSTLRCPEHLGTHTSHVAGNGKWNVLQGYLAHKKTTTPLGSPQSPRDGRTVGSYGGVLRGGRFL